MSGKQPFQPGNIRGHVYLLATGYLAYLIYQNIRHCMEQGYVTPLQLGGTLLLAAGAVLLGILTWRGYPAPPEAEEDSALPEETAPEEDAEIREE